ncbi:pimeloyl-ACP methyl ester carboxylesterase [Streptacidiphilus sp. MAP12-20]|uniref:alpha/beta fold hydrolase n=1 Tax=Streptacidiphilus sp. MAP12-20 TaxID=3156299 RepID=UPI003511376B
MTELQVKAADGRTLAAATWGRPDGRPVFLLHGTPGSRLHQTPRPSLLSRLGLRVITFDRPGYGDSDRRPGRRVADAAEDVRTIADHLGLTRFSVVGRSGGAPHALACAALLADRVIRTAALVSLAPWDARDLDWQAGMGSGNARSYRKEDPGERRLATSLRIKSRDIREDPQRLLEEFRGELPASDRWVLASGTMTSLLRANYREALRRDGGGWIDDALAFRQPWGFDVSDIPGEVLLWHGEDDVFSPVEHTLWLGERIPHSRVVVRPFEGHFGAMRVMPEVLHWASRDSPEAPSSAI